MNDKTQLTDERRLEKEEIEDLGTVTLARGEHVIHCLTVIGQIEGHYLQPSNTKTTKYEHVIPQLAAVQEDPRIEGLLVLLNTVGGDVEAGLALAELIASISKPSATVVLGGGHSIGIPLAAGVFVGLGLTLNPMYGAAAMSLSSFCVVSNALRLNLFDLHSTRHDHKTASPAAAPVQSAAENNKKSDAEAPEVKTEDHTMKKTLKVEGMMCGHCEARVKKALEALPEVDEAVVSHEAGTAIVTLNAEVADDVLKNAVEAQDYKVTGIQ